MAMTINLWAQSGLDKTASEIIGEMSPGINLGNTLEATTSWMRPAGREPVPRKPSSTT